MTKSIHFFKDTITTQKVNNELNIRANYSCKKFKSSELLNDCFQKNNNVSFNAGLKVSLNDFPAKNAEHIAEFGSINDLDKILDLADDKGAFQRALNDGSLELHQKMMDIPGSLSILIRD